MRALFTVAEILAVTGGQLLQGSAQTPVSGFAFDSRQVVVGDCFVAMPGERVDGHDYVPTAAALGAACILVGRPVAVPERCTVVMVADPLLALGQLGRSHRERFDLPIIAVTGSVGKTTTKELVAAVLSCHFAVFRSLGNFNSEVGLPITLMDLTDQDQVAVVEMGMRALGEIAYLVSIARPLIGVVTNVGVTHMELLGTQDNIVRAKAELVRGLDPSGTAVLNADDPLVLSMVADTPCKVWFYGFSARDKGERYVTVSDLRSEGEAGQRFVLVTPLGRVEAFLPAPGTHNVQNAMAAAAVGLELGMDLAEVAEGISRYVPSGRRMRILHVGGVRLLDDTYNAAPSSVIAALGVMHDLAGPGGRSLAVLGDMFELGPAAQAGHEQVGVEAGRLADIVFTVGDLGQTIATAALGRASHFTSKATLISALIAAVRPGDTVLVKGSRGMAMEEIVEALQNHLSQSVSPTDTGA